MANPEHIAELDTFDRLTVSLYRAGLVIGVAGLVGVSLAAGIGRTQLPGMLALLAGVLLSVGNLHLYDKRVRWVIVGSALLGSWGFALGLGLGVPVIQLAGLGFAFVALSGLALKEQFCFKIPLLRWVPVLLAAGLVPLVLDIGWATAALLGLAALPLSALVVAKLRMPLHFDIGDKGRYQV